MSLEEALTAVEQHIEQVSGALLSLDAPALEAASTALRDAAARFTWVLEQSKGISAAQLPPQFEQRLAAIGQQLAVQRDNLARVSVITDRQVAVVDIRRADALRAMGRLPEATEVLRKAVGAGSRVVVTAEDALLRRLDVSLWSFAPLEFLPHCHSSAQQQVLAASPVVLAPSLGVDAREHEDHLRQHDVHRAAKPLGYCTWVGGYSCRWHAPRFSERNQGCRPGWRERIKPAD